MEETIELFKPVPKMRNKKERIIQGLLAFVLSFGFLLISLLFWWQTNWYVALFSLPFSYLVIGIISSKLVHLSVPFKQREFHYSSMQIAAWSVRYWYGSDDLQSL